ncbi:MAG: YihY/virulence factor BrkB family protein [Proteobacteria bacterium]|nr:YihY/virulence factor BrkB family protein [Pseudomonadota bacterium]
MKRMDRLRPLENGLKHLLRFVGRVIAAFLRNRGILLAGGVGYNALLSLVPFLTLSLATLSLFFEEARILGILRGELRSLVPQYTDTLVQTAATFLQNKVATSAVSIIVLLFFSSIAFRMLEEAVAAIFLTTHKGPHRRFWISALLPYLFMLMLMIALFFMTLLTSGLDALGDHSLLVFGAVIAPADGVKLVLHVGGFLGLVLAFAGIYRVLPVRRISMRRALVGGLCAAILWRLVGVLLVYYFTNISMVNLIYGSLATVVVMLLFLEITFIILLLGAQVIAELEASAAAGVPWHQKPSSKEPA